MRTNVVLDDDLVSSALSLSGFKTKKKAIEEGLKTAHPGKSSEKNQGLSRQIKVGKQLK